MARVTRRNLRPDEGWLRVIPTGSFLRVSTATPRQRLKMNIHGVTFQPSPLEDSGDSALQWVTAPTSLQTLKLSFGGGFQVEF